jgi:hypothetical protein
MYLLAAGFLTNQTPVRPLRYPCRVQSEVLAASKRYVTALVGSVDPSQNPTVSRWLQMEASVSKLLVALTNSHAASLPCDNRKETTGCLIDAKGLTSSWCSIAITSELYLTAVLGLWNAGKPLERRLLRILFYTLVRDIAQHAKN